MALGMQMSCHDLNSNTHESPFHLCPGLPATLRQVYRYQSWGGAEALPLFQRGQQFQPAAIDLKQVGGADQGACTLWHRACCPVLSALLPTLSGAHAFTVPCPTVSTRRARRSRRRG